MQVLRPLFALAGLGAFLSSSPMKAQPNSPPAEAARILEAGGCVLLDGTPAPALTEVARNPSAFTGKRIRVSGIWEQFPSGLRVTQESTAAFLEITLPPLPGAAARLRERGLARIASTECAGRAVVAVSGTLLRQGSGQIFAVERFDGIEPAGRPYTGLLTAGECYRAQVLFDPAGGLHLATSPRLPAHHAGRVEWTNRKDIPKLLRPPLDPPHRFAVFRVLSADVQKAGDTLRWNTTYRCRIYRLD